MASVRFEDDETIVRAINNGSIEDDDLEHRECWRRICQARGSHGRVDPEAWQKLCTRRGRLIYNR
jgi:hypothetical protein